jgi:predicted nucleic acid-binding protein
MIVVDTSVWIGFLAGVVNPQVEMLQSITDRTRILVGDVVLLEVLRGVPTERKARDLEAKFRKFRTVSMLNEEIALAAARNYRELRSHGITIRNFADLVIGTYSIEHGHHVLHRDRDFTHMESLGLKSYQP